jgi:hypothetical protein
MNYCLRRVFVKKKKKLSESSLLSLFGSLSPKGSSTPKDWVEIREESREQYVSQRISPKEYRK